MRRPEIRIIQPQQEEVTDQRNLSEEETKAFLYKHHPEMYKKMYPEQTVPKKREAPKQPLPPQKREGQDIQKSDNTYIYNKYGDAKIDDQTNFGYNIEIKTDMKFKR